MHLYSYNFSNGCKIILFTIGGSTAGGGGLGTAPHIQEKCTNFSFFSVSWISIWGGGYLELSPNPSNLKKLKQITFLFCLSKSPPSPQKKTPRSALAFYSSNSIQTQPIFGISVAKNIVGDSRSYSLITYSLIYTDKLTIKIYNYLIYNCFRAEIFV